jgi:hypothetical protein
MMHLNNSIRYKRSFVNINPQSNTDFTQVTCTVHLYYIYTNDSADFWTISLSLARNCPQGGEYITKVRAGLKVFINVEAVWRMEAIWRMEAVLRRMEFIQCGREP